MESTHGRLRCYVQEMSEMRAALSQILEASEPNPTLVVNRRYDILLTNDAACGCSLISHLSGVARTTS
jgi:hypothetical protein